MPEPKTVHFFGGLWSCSPFEWLWLHHKHTQIRLSGTHTLTRFSHLRAHRIIRQMCTQASAHASTHFYFFLNGNMHPHMHTHQVIRCARTFVRLLDWDKGLNFELFKRSQHWILNSKYCHIRIVPKLEFIPWGCIWSTDPKI